MLLPLLNPMIVATPAGAVEESAKAVRDLGEAEWDVKTINEDGTMDVRLLVSNVRGAFRATYLNDGKVVGELALAGEKTLWVDHVNRQYQENWDLKKFSKLAVEAMSKKPELEPGNLYVNLDAQAGLVVLANPGLENVQTWRSGAEEMITGDFGKGKDARGTFRWTRDAKTKLPKTFVGTMDGNRQEWRFAFKPRKLDAKAFEVPKKAYAGYDKADFLKDGGFVTGG